MNRTRLENMELLVFFYNWYDKITHLHTEAGDVLYAITLNPTETNIARGVFLVSVFERWFRRLEVAFLEDRFMALYTAGQAPPVGGSRFLDATRNRLAKRAAVRTVLIDFLTEVGITITGPGSIVIGYFEPLTHSQMLSLIAI